MPAYFALILRAFSVIEGIALRVDPTYSIVKVATPAALLAIGAWEPMNMLPFHSLCR